MAYTLPVKIGYYKAKYYTMGRAGTVKAIVNHRMVGYVIGTRRYFTVSADRPVSTHFGIGLIDGRLTIDQYVPLDDTAYGNGNIDPSGVWDDWGYPTTAVNAQTINIEHQDHGDPAGTGVVPASVQQASIALQALLLRGSLAEWKAAGIVMRDWNRNGPVLQKELRAITPGPRRIITHHDISGRLKPYCWMPWQSDKVGFPRTKYIEGINKIIESQNAPAPTPEDDMRAFTLLDGPSGTIRAKGTGHYYLDCMTNKLIGPVPDGWPGEAGKRAHPARLVEPIPGGTGDRQTGYVMGVNPAFMLEVDVTFTPDSNDKTQPNNAAELRALADKVEKGVENA